MNTVIAICLWIAFFGATSGFVAFVICLLAMAFTLNAVINWVGVTAMVLAALFRKQS